jgi:hypothetical protein
MKTPGGSRSTRRKTWPVWVAACFALLVLNSAIWADSTGSPPITEPANAPGSALAPVPAATGGPSVPNPGSSASSANHSTAATTNSSAAATSLEPNAPSAVGTTATSSGTATAATIPSTGSLAPRTLTLPAGTVAVPPLTGQTATLDPSDPAAAGFDANADIANYERFQNPDAYQPQMPIQQFINDEDNVISPLGVEVREDQRKLKSGEDATGLLITGVTSGSPAAKAGLHAHTDTARNVLEGAAVAGALVFPPAVLLAPIIANVPLGESYDLIIAVDGWRVMNFIEFQDRLRDLQPGEIVYLSVIRNGSRLQVPVKLPQDLAAAAPRY